MKGVCCLAALVAIAAGQAPNPVRLAGVAMDVDGKPLPDVLISHIGPRGQMSKTNEEGRFEVLTRAPAVVFRKSGFTSWYQRVEQAGPIEVRLEPVRQSLAACASPARCTALRGFPSSFCLPRVRGVKASKQGNDSDYGQRLFTASPSRSRAAIQHAAGSMWGSGLPLDTDVWSSVEYRETVSLDLHHLPIYDSRGRTADGKRWRLAGHAFESAGYRGASLEEARLLDQVLDGICLLKEP